MVLFRVSKNWIIWGGNYFSNLLKNSQCWIFWDKKNGDSDFSDGELAYTSFEKGLRKFETAKELNKSQSTIGKEIRNNRKRRYSQTEDSPWKCKHYKDCKVCIKISDVYILVCFKT